MFQRGRQVEPERELIHPVEVGVLLQGREGHPVDREDGEDDIGRDRGVDPEVASDLFLALRAWSGRHRPVLSALEVSEHQDHQGQQQGEKKQGDRRPSSERSGLDPNLVGEHGQDLRGVRRTALGQEIHDAEIGQREHGVEEETDQQDRRDHRYDDVTKTLKEARPVHPRGVQDLVGHRREPCEQHDRRERKVAPHVDHDARGQRQVRLAQPHRPVSGAVGSDDADPAQEPVDDTELGVVHPLPAEHADTDRERERDHDEAANELLAPEGLKQEKREAGSEQALEDGGHQGEADAVAERDEEDVALEGGPEILQPDEVRRGVGDRGIAQRQKEREQERNSDEEQHVEDGGREQEVAEGESPGRLAREPPSRARANSDRDGSGPGACRVRAAARRASGHACLCFA